MSESNSLQTSKSNPLLILLSIKKLPRLFKKLPSIFKNIEANFLTGILIGAIFSLFVNILTNQIGESIARQKSLEALEIEINSHHFLDLTIINNYSNGIYKKSKSYFYTIYHYDDHVWKSLASTTFFYSMSPNAQAILSSYYSYIETANNELSDNDQIVHPYLASSVACEFTIQNCEKEITIENNITDFFTHQQYNWAMATDHKDYDISKVFHPTRDRLKDPILSFLMGKEALGSLALPWKPPSK